MEEKEIRVRLALIEVAEKALADSVDPRAPGARLRLAGQRKHLEELLKRANPPDVVVSLKPATINGQALS